MPENCLNDFLLRLSSPSILLSISSLFPRFNSGWASVFVLTVGGSISVNIMLHKDLLLSNQYWNKCISLNLISIFSSVYSASWRKVCKMFLLDDEVHSKGTFGTHIVKTIRYVFSFCLLNIPLYLLWSNF